MKYIYIIILVFFSSFLLSACASGEGSSSCSKDVEAKGSVFLSSITSHEIEVTEYNKNSQSIGGSINVSYNNESKTFMAYSSFGSYDGPILVFIIPEEGVLLLVMSDGKIFDEQCKSLTNEAKTKIPNYTIIQWEKKK